MVLGCLKSAKWKQEKNDLETPLDATRGLSYFHMCFFRLSPARLSTDGMNSRRVFRNNDS